ncbi:hypothetical protein MTO96_001323 [Rhipicephalus appendiculatus]
MAADVRRRVFRASLPRVQEECRRNGAVAACFRVSLLKPWLPAGPVPATGGCRSSGRSGVSIAEGKARPPSSPRTARGQPPRRGGRGRRWPARMRGCLLLATYPASAVYDSNVRS